MENGCISKGGITLNKNIRVIVWRGVLVYCLVFLGCSCGCNFTCSGDVNHETDKKNQSKRRKNFFRMAC